MKRNILPDRELERRKMIPEEEHRATCRRGKETTEGVPLYAVS